MEILSACIISGFFAYNFQSVQHPHIVKLFEVLTIKNYIGIVLQRAAGNTTKNWMIIFEIIKV